MIRQFALTVSESKRLIARAVARMDVLQRAQSGGMLVIATGSTNSYLVEEVLGRPSDKRTFLSGVTVPKNPERLPEPHLGRMAGLVFRRGEIVSGLDRFTSVPHLRAGDVFVKGANALDYRNKTVGILIGSASSGTIGNAIGALIGRGCPSCRSYWPREAGLRGHLYNRPETSFLGLRRFENFPRHHGDYCNRDRGLEDADRSGCYTCSVRRNRRRRGKRASGS